MSVDIDNVKKIAKLSKISLSENEIKKMGNDLIAYHEQFQRSCWYELF